MNRLLFEVRNPLKGRREGKHRRANGGNYAQRIEKLIGGAGIRTYNLPYGTRVVIH